MILEHVTTANGVDFVRDAGRNMAATITTHHLFINRNHILLVVLGRIITACLWPNVNAIDWHQWPRRHLVHRNFSLAQIALRILIPTSNQHAAVRAFIQHQIPYLVWPMCLRPSSALNQLEAFTSLNGAAFYGLPPASDNIKLVKRDQAVVFPASRTTAQGEVTIFDCGVPLYWEIETSP